MTTATKPRPSGKRWYSYGPEVCDWIEEYCVLPTGDHAGQPFRLMNWQRDWICELFAADAKGTLRYRWSLLGVPKGNGKSPLVAALALYHLLGDPDEDDPWVVVAAASDKQADIVFGACREMCRRSPKLAALTISYRWEIRAKSGSGKIERVACSGGKLDGKLISLLICDELHEWLEQNWIILTGGALKRKRSQIVQVTTAGFDRESRCFKEYAKGLRILSGEEVNPSYFMRWYGLPEGADYRDMALLKACNPSWGVIVHEETMRDIIANQPESQVRRYRGNQWVETEEHWLPVGAWEACNGEATLTPKARTWVGWDASTKRDSTAIVAIQADEAGKVRVQQRTWSRPTLPNGHFDESWRVPVVECEKHIRSLCEEYTVDAIAFDPAFITWSADELEAGGLPMEEWPQSPQRMCPATAALYEAVVQGKIAHGGDPLLARHMHSVKPRNMRGGGQMLEKGPQHRQIDAAIALVMAIGVMKKSEAAEVPGTWGGLDTGGSEVAKEGQPVFSGGFPA